MAESEGGNQKYTPEFIREQRGIWERREYASDREQELEFSLPIARLSKWRCAKEPDGTTWERPPRAEAGREPDPVEPEAVGEAITGELESRLALVSMVEQLTAAVMASLTGESALKPRNFNDLTSALATAGRIMEMQLKAIEGLRESEERIEQKLIRVVVDLSDYLQLTPGQCARLAEVRLAGVVPRAGESQRQPRRVEAPPAYTGKKRGPKPRSLRLETGERVGFAPEEEPEEEPDPDALLRRERDQFSAQVPPGAEKVPEVQLARRALDEFEAAPVEGPVRAPGPEEALGIPQHRKMRLSPEERERRRNLGKQMAPKLAEWRARQRAEKERSQSEVAKETP